MLRHYAKTPCSESPTASQSNSNVCASDDLLQIGAGGIDLRYVYSNAATLAKTRVWLLPT